MSQVPRSTAANLQELSGLKWLTRVPLSLKAASELVSELPESALEPTELEGYRMVSVCCRYGSVQQRWFVVESRQRKQAELKKLDKTVARATSQWQSQLQKLCTQDFACEADALAALNPFEQHLPWHHLEGMSVKQRLHYQRPGKPK